MVCQIDVLQRLRPDSGIIRDALRNLPKTLDETYERIFLQIPEEARIFVHHTLRWIHCHGEVWGESASGTFLLQAVQTGLPSTIPSIQGYVFDEELLREFCGCLITITSNQTVKGQGSSLGFEVSFAHYTVLEFLQSPRIWNGPTAFFGIDEETSNLEFAKIMILEALDFQHNDVSDWEMWGSVSSHVLENHFRLYCTVSSIILLRLWGHQICRNDDLVALACDLLDPLKPHYEDLKLVVGEFYHFRGIPGDFEPYDAFWMLKWHELPVINHAVTLLNLLFTDKSTGLAKAFLKNTNAKAVLGSQLDLDIVVYQPPISYPEFHFQGSIVELCAQLRMRFLVFINFLLDFKVECLDLSKVLLSFAGRHMHEIDCENTCLLLRLLQLGAAPTMAGYRISPLQMAVAAWDFEGVKLLLEAGADANDTGDEDGIGWGEDTMLGTFHEIRGESPLCIIRNFDYHGFVQEEAILEARKDACAKIEALLLEYGAHESTTRDELSGEESSEE